MIPWERFRSTVAEAEALARPEECDTLEKLGEHYAGIRRWSPAFLAALEFEGVPTCASLMRSITVLREANRSGDDLPKSAPTGFVRQRSAPYNGMLKVASIEKATPPEAETLAEQLYAMLPRIRITDLLAEVARWTKFLDCFTHLRTGEVAGDSRVLWLGC